MLASILILGALVSLGVGLVFVVVLLALVIIVSIQMVLGKAPPPRADRPAPLPPPAPRAPAEAPSPPAARAPAVRDPAPARAALGQQVAAAAPGPEQAMASPSLARPDAPAALRPTPDAGPALRACRECLSVIADPTSESCPVCGGELAPQRQLGAPGLVRNPMQVVRDERLRAWIGSRLDDVYGARIGTVESVVLDPETEVVWLLVRVQRFGDWHTLVPAQGAMLSNGRLLVRYPRSFVRDGPRGLTTDAYLWGPYRSRLYRYYRPTGKPRNRHPETVAVGAPTAQAGSPADLLPHPPTSPSAPPRRRPPRATSSSSSHPCAATSG
jgi:hypothetical protein